MLRKRYKSIIKNILGDIKKEKLKIIKLVKRN